MAQYELLLPKMGESVAEATVIKWVKQPGERIELDDTILEIATDKVDSEVPAPVAGTLVKQLYKEDDVVQVGDVIAIIETEGTSGTADLSAQNAAEEPAPATENIAAPEPEEEQAEVIPGMAQLSQSETTPESDRFYSPLVKNIASQEGISLSELETIPGTGADGRLTKDDLLKYISGKNPVFANTTSSIQQTSLPETRLQLSRYKKLKHRLLQFSLLPVCREATRSWKWTGCVSSLRITWSWVNKLLHRLLPWLRLR